MNEFPKMVYRAGGPHEIHGGMFDTGIVDDQDEQDEALAYGWHLTTTEAKDAVDPERIAAEQKRIADEEAAALAEASRAAEEAAHAEAERLAAEDAARLEAEEAARAEAERIAAAATANANNVPPTRDELKQKAAELGIDFPANIPTAKLAELIDEAEKA